LSTRIPRSIRVEDYLFATNLIDSQLLTQGNCGLNGEVFKFPECGPFVLGLNVIDGTHEKPRNSRLRLVGSGEHLRLNAIVVNTGDTIT